MTHIFIFIIMRHILISFFISALFTNVSHAQSSKEIKREAKVKQENFQRLVEKSVQNHQQMVERGTRTEHSIQMASLEEPIASSAEKQFLYVEVWTPKQAWLNLSKENRQEFLNKVGGEIQKLSNEGIDVLGFAMHDPETPYRAGHQYIAVWQMPSQKHGEMLEERISKAGWYEYFEQVNASGKLVPLPAALEDLAGLKK